MSKKTAVLLLFALLLLLCGCGREAVPEQEGAPTYTGAESTPALNTNTEHTDTSERPDSDDSTTISEDSTSLTENETSEDKMKNGYKICIDAGHQKKGIPEKEPNGPGSSVMKAKLSSGTAGVSTRIPEHVLNLEVSLMLRDELEARGYEVVMIRESDDCPKSNAERAVIANESGADVFIRIHANGSSNPSVHGALTCAPTLSNEFLDDALVRECIRLSEKIINAFCKATGAADRGIYSTDTMTGINWCKIPVTIVEMGYMSNAEEDKLMATSEYREKMVNGIANGIDAYLGEE